MTVPAIVPPPPPRVPANAGSRLTPYQQFLFRQSHRIIARGGSLADVADYIQHAEQHNIKAAVEPPREGVDTPGMIRGLSQQVLQGVTFGFGDEALGSLYGLVTGEGSQAGRDLYRAELAAYRQAHPVISTGANIAGAIALPIGVAGKALGSGGKLAAAGVGALTGALSGAGEAQGGLSERAKGALLGALIGAPLGAAAPGMARVAGRMAGSVGRTLEPVVQRVAPAVASAWEAAIDALPGSPARVARRLLADAMVRDALSPTIAANRVGQRAAMDLPTTLADVGGDHVMGLAQTAAKFRTPEQQMLVARLLERQSAQGGRLLGAIGTASRVGLQNAYTLSEQIMAQRAAQAEPLYREAFEQVAPLTKKLRSVLANPIFREAYTTGRATSLAEDAAGLNRGLPVPELPGIQVSELPVRALDYMKRGLDHFIEQSGQEGRPPLARQTAKALRARLNEALDEIDVPSYKQARDIWRSHSEQLDALAQGQENFLRKAPEVVARELAASPHPDMYRIGAIQALADAVHGTGPEATTLAQRFFGASLYGTKDQSALRRLQALFPDATTAEEFADRLAGEVASTQSFARLGKRGMPNPSAAAAELERLAGGPGLTARVARRAGVSEGPRLTRQRDIANELTMLFTTGLDDPNELVSLLRSVEATNRLADMGIAALRITGGELGGQASRR